MAARTDARQTKTIMKILYTEDYDTALMERLTDLQKHPDTFPVDRRLEDDFLAALRAARLVGRDASSLADVLRSTPALAEAPVFQKAFLRHYRLGSSETLLAMREEQEQRLDTFLAGWDAAAGEEMEDVRDCLFLRGLSKPPVLIPDAVARDIPSLIDVLRDGRNLEIRLVVTSPDEMPVRVFLCSKTKKLLMKAYLIPKSGLAASILADPRIETALSKATQKDRKLRQFTVSALLHGDDLPFALREAALRLRHEYPEEGASVLTGGIVWARDDIEARLMEEDPFELPTKENLPAICEAYIREHDIIRYDGQDALAALMERKVSVAKLRRFATGLLSEEDAMAMQAVTALKNENQSASR